MTIEWCKCQKRGIKLTEPNDNLAKEYIQTAEETLDVLRKIKGQSKVWLATTKYYCEYFAFYSFLMKLGVKCEIHDCTVEVCRLLEKNEVIPQGYAKILEDDKQLRIDNQYYLKNRDVDVDYDKLVEFVLAMKNLSLTITADEIERAREIIKNNKTARNKPKC